MAAVGSALIDKQIRDQWEHFESLLKDRSIRVDRLGDEPSEGWMVHGEGFTAFICVKLVQGRSRAPAEAVPTRERNKPDWQIGSNQAVRRGS